MRKAHKKLQIINYKLQMKEGNLILEKSYNFSLRITKLYKYLKVFADSIIKDCEEICKILSRIQITCNNNQ